MKFQDDSWLGIVYSAVSYRFHRQHHNSVYAACSSVPLAYSVRSPEYRILRYYVCVQSFFLQYTLAGTNRVENIIISFGSLHVHTPFSLCIHDISRSSHSSDLSNAFSLPKLSRLTIFPAYNSNYKIALSGCFFNSYIRYAVLTRGQCVVHGLYALVTCVYIVCTHCATNAIETVNRCVGPYEMSAWKFLYEFGICKFTCAATIFWTFKFFCDTYLYGIFTGKIINRQFTTPSKIYTFFSIYIILSNIWDNRITKLKTM